MTDEEAAAIAYASACAKHGIRPYSIDQEKAYGLFVAGRDHERSRQSERNESRVICYHCHDVIEEMRAVCDKCPYECDVEGCDAPGCALDHPAPIEPEPKDSVHGSVAGDCVAAIAVAKVDSHHPLVEPEPERKGEVESAYDWMCRVQDEQDSIELKSKCAADGLRAAANHMQKQIEQRDAAVRAATIAEAIDACESAGCHCAMRVAALEKP